MKKLINDPARVTDESVEGFGWAHADLVAVHTDPMFVLPNGVRARVELGAVPRLVLLECAVQSRGS